MSNDIKNTAITAAGYIYQNRQGLRVLCDWLDAPARYVRVKFECDDEAVAPKGLDDIVVERSDRVVDLQQVKFTPDPDAHLLSWDWMLEKTGKTVRSRSMLRKWFDAFKKLDPARIAGCIHVFEGAQAAIPRETMQRAVTLARWYLREALRVLDVLDEPQAWADARLLDAWLAAAGDSPIRDVLRLGPGPLRDKARRNAAVDVLAELGRARIKRDGRRETLARNPALRRLATATPATFATDAGDEAGSVARVATVAVAESQNEEIERGEL